MKWLAGLILAVSIGVLGAVKAPAITFGVIAFAGIVYWTARSKTTTPVALVWLLTLAFIPYWAAQPIGPLVFPPTSLIAIACLVGLAIRGDRIRLQRGDWFIATLVLLTATGVMLGASPSAAFRDVVCQWLPAYLLARILFSASNARAIWLWWTRVAFTVAALALIEYAIGWHPYVDFPAAQPYLQHWSDVQSRGGTTRSEWSFGTPLALGGFLAVSVPIAVIAVRRARWRLLVVATLLLGIAASVSRGPLVAALLGLVLVYFGARKTHGLQRGVIPALLVAGGLGFFLSGTYSRIVSESNGELANSSAYRSQSLAASINDIRPLGLARYTQFDRTGAMVHRGYGSIDNTFLNLGLQFGWLPVVVMLLAIVAMSWRLLLGKASLPELVLVATVPFLATVALVTQLTSVVWFIAGAAVALTHALPERADQVREASSDAALGAAHERRGGT